MKKFILSLALLIASTTAFSQVTFKPGARVGANFANVSNLESETKTDLYLGAFLEIQFSGFYALQPEMNYSRQGAKSKVSDGEDLELQYLGLSIANKFSPFKDLDLHFIAGPGIDVKVSDNVDYIDTTPLDFVIFGGIGYVFPIGLSIEGRYKQGFLELDNGNFNSGENGYSDKNNLNSVIQIGVSYKFDFSK